MTLSFRNKLLASHVAVALVAGGAAAVLIESSLAARLEAQADRRLESQARAVAHWIQRAQHFDQLATRLAGVVGARVTFIDPFGVAVGDSARGPGAAPAIDPEGMHAEIAAARDGRVGTATRHSVVTGHEMRYLAVPGPRELVVRLGLPTTDIHESRAALLRPLLAGAGASLAVAVLLAAFLSRALSRRVGDLRAVAERIGRGDYENLPAPEPGDEIGVLGNTLALAGRQLGEHEARRREFLANVAHELRTPVTSIRGYAETLRSGSIDPATRDEFVGIVHRNAVRIARLVDDLLALEALAEAPIPRDRLGPVELRAAVGHVLDTAAPLAAEAGARVESEVGELTVVADADALEQVLLNLVDNAIRSGKDGVSVRIAAEKKRGRVEITVADDGPGIAAEHLPRLFERFYRAGPSATERRAAGGLGLAIARGLAEAMDGSIAVNSQLERGTTFTVELPATET